MPRGGGRSGGSRSSSPNRSAGSFSQKPASRPTPTPTSTTASRPTTGGGMFSGLGGMFVSGMALGAGSEIGHQAMRGLMGTGQGGQQQTQEQYQSQSEPTTQASTSKYTCQTENDNFVSCLKSNSDSISFCQTYLDVLKECEKKMKY